MNEQLTNKVTEMLGFLLDSVKNAQEFVVAQAPDVIREIILVGRFKHTIGVIMGIICFAGFVKLVHLLCTHKDQWSSDKQSGMGILTVLSIAPVFFCMLFNFIPCFSAWFAPKYYVITELANLMKKF